MRYAHFFICQAARLKRAETLDTIATTHAARLDGALSKTSPDSGRTIIQNNEREMIMKISKLIQELEKAKQELGDVDVFASSECAIGIVTDIEKTDTLEDGMIIVINNEHS